MQTNNLQFKIEVVRSVMDEMATFEHDTPQGKRNTLQLVIDSLGSYPKPRTKDNTNEPNAHELGAYLCMSNVRNACNLAMFGIYDNHNTMLTIDQNNTQALTLLLALQ